MKGRILILLLAICLGISTSAYSVLIDRGVGMIYDTDLGITWLQDANYSQTSGYDTDGRMPWEQANTWAAGLDFGGYQDWRLPQTLPVNGTSYNYEVSYDGSTDVGWNISAPGSVYPGSTGSEMAHMFYNSLGNKANSGLQNTGPFRNLQPLDYWSSTIFAPHQDAGYAFYFHNGYQPQGVNMLRSLSAWAVRDGDYGPSVSPGTPYITDPILLGQELSFDFWWVMGIEPTEFNFDILFFRGDDWEILGADFNFDGSSEDWETLSLTVPEWARGLETQVMFRVFDLGQETNPTVYLNNIESAPVPEPATMLLLGTGLVGLAALSRKKFKK